MADRPDKPPFTPPPGVKPGAFDKATAAWYVSLSESTIERGVREEWFPAPRELSKGRVGWLTEDLDAFLRTRPKSSLPPPPNTGHYNRRRKVSAEFDAPAPPAPPAARQGA